MKTFKVAGLMLVAISSLFLANCATEPPVTDGPRFEEVNPPASTEGAEKVEVVEFFWYGCPHCYHLDSLLAEWLDKKPENVEFRRIPAPLSARWTAHSRFFYAAEVMGVGNKVHKPLYEALHGKKLTLFRKEELISFAAQHGIDEQQFRQAWDSSAVDMKIERSKELVAQYRVTGVPTIGINGKYKTGTKWVDSYPEVIDVLNELVARESSP